MPSPLNLRARLTARTVARVARVAMLVERTAATVAWRAAGQPHLLCSECGGPNVQSMEWVSHGEGHTVRHGEQPFEGADNNWCDDCCEHVYLATGEDLAPAGGQPRPRLNGFRGSAA